MKSYIKNKEINVLESIRNYFNKIANENIVANRNIWKIITHFLTNKGHLENAETMLILDKKIISNEHELVKVFNTIDTLLRYLVVTNRLTQPKVIL